MDSGLKILVADDDRVGLSLAEDFLERQGHVVAVARTGWEALTASAEGCFDLLLLKRNLPVMDGLAALGAIRESEMALGRIPTPVIMATPFDSLEEKCRCLAAGADACVDRFSGLESLLRVIDRVLRARRLPKPRPWSEYGEAEN